MASASVVLDIRANTQKALSEFKKFSSQLDNKFLVSGLKLDVVRSSLSQINKEFQKAIGEQGMAAGSSIRAAENQAALLTQTFKNFSAEASLDLQTQFSKAFSQIAITAGGTGEDIQKALSATPFISTSLSEDLRKQLGEGILTFQKDLRRAGVASDFGNIAKQFLSSEISAENLIEQGGAAGAFLGRELQKRGVERGAILTPLERSQALLEIISDPEISAQLKNMAERASGFKIIIEDLFTNLFNPDAGVFGSFREVSTLIDGQLVRTNIFKETYSLIKTIFDPREGLFVSFFKRVGEVFGIKDPLDIIIRGIRFITTQFEKLKEFVNSPEFQAIVTTIKGAFDTIKNWALETFGKIQQDFENPDGITNQIKQIGSSVFNFFKSIFDTIKTGEWDPSKVTDSIKKIGETAREFIENVGESIRGADIKKEGNFFLEIFKTLVGEIAETLGTAIKEAIRTVFSEKGFAALGGTLSVLYEALSRFFTGLFDNGGVGGVAGALGTAGIVAAFGKKISLGLLGLAKNIIDALPGGQTLRTALQRRLPKQLGGGDLAPTSSFEGGERGFQAQMLALVKNIASCVCRPGALGGGGGGDIDINGDGPEARRERARTRRGPTGPGMPKRAPLTSLDTANPYAYSRSAYLPEPDTRSSYLKMQREARRNAIKGTSSSKYFDLYTESLGGVSGPFSDLGPDERGLMASRSLESPEALERQERVRQRYNQRFSKRARFGRALKGFGKGALIAGGIAGGIALLSGGGAQASEIDPMTGEPAQPKVGVGEAFGRVGMGAAEGALTGAMFGPWGAAIGGVIGGGIALMDKGVRDSIGKFISDSASNLMRMGGDLVDGLKKNVLGAFESLKTLASGIDWKGILIRALIPGGDFTIKGLQGLGEFASKLGIFDAIKSGIDKISSFVSNIWNRVKAANPLRLIGLGGDDENNYDGANYYGPALAQEGRMSAGKPLVVNSREFVIPSDGFSTLANMVENRLNTGANRMVNMSPTINLTINATGMSGNDIAEAIRNPVIDIVNEAWERATAGTVTRGALA